MSDIILASDQLGDVFSACAVLGIAVTGFFWARKYFNRV